MELNNDFRVSVPPVEAWKVLTDVERIAPLLPGAQLQEVDGDEYRGIVKVKVGPITAQYRGTATFLEQDQSAGHLVLKASGRDTRGQGNASATITVDMEPAGDGTKVGVLTDLTITGKVAQFGRGVLADVTEKLIKQFVDALEADIGSGGGSDGQIAGGDVEGGAVAEAAADGSPSGAGGKSSEGGSSSENGQSDPPSAGSEAPSAEAPRPEAVTPSGPRRIDSPEPEPVDLLDAAGGSVAKRIAPLAGAGLLVLLLVLLRRSRRSRRKNRRVAAAIPDLGPAKELGRKAAKRARGELAAAEKLSRKAAKRAQAELAAAEKLSHKAAELRARAAARR